WNPPGQIEGDEFQAHGLATGRVATAQQIPGESCLHPNTSTNTTHDLLVVCGTRSGELWSIVVPTSAAEIEAVRGVDPTAGMRTVRVQGRVSGATRLDPAAWQSAVALSRRAVAHQIAGATRTMLELARTHALERVQFGRPIARFQAVRHRLADVLV